MNTIELTQIIGTVHQITPAPAANRSGRIKLDSGQILSAYPEKLKLAVEGGTYEFGCSETHKGGVVYYDVKIVRPVEAVDASQFRAPVARPQRGPTAPQQSPAPVVKPAPSNGNGNGYYRPTSPEDKKSMFRCACVTAAIKSRQVALTRDTLAELIAEIDAAYDMAVIENLAAG